MSKDVIKRKDLETLEKLITFLMEVVMTSKQRAFLEIELKANISPIWLGGRTVKIDQRMLHDILDAIDEEKTTSHTSGLTVSELYRIAVLMGINREQIETNKALIWWQIKRRISPELSRADAQTILYTLLDDLEEDEIKWLKRFRPIGWEGYAKGDQEWLEGKATTITECIVRIEDILQQIENETELIRYNLRIRNVDFLELLGRLLEAPSSVFEKRLSKGILKAELLRVIENNKNKNK